MTTSPADQLSPSLPVKVFWGDGTPLDGPYASYSLLRSYLRSGKYSVKVIDNAGRSGYTTVEVVVPPKVLSHSPRPFTGTTTDPSFVQIVLYGENLIEGTQFSLDGQTWYSDLNRESDSRLRLVIPKQLFANSIFTVAADPVTGTPTNRVIAVWLRSPLPNSTGAWRYSEDAYTITLETSDTAPFSSAFGVDFEASRGIVTQTATVPLQSRTTDMRAVDVLAWIGADHDRAVRALQEESATQFPRAQVVSYATAIITGTG